MGIPETIEQNSEFNPIGKNAICGSGDSFVEDKRRYHGLKLLTWNHML